MRMRHGLGPAAARNPIDGTLGYIHGTTRRCVLNAYVRHGQIEIGGIYAPAGDRLFAVRRSRGAFLNGRRLQVSHLGHSAAPVVEVGWSERRPLSACCEVLQCLGAAGFEFRRHGSGALGLAEVAAGLNDGNVELHINARDALAGILLVQEAGCCTNDFLSGEGMRRGNPLFAVTPEICEKIETMLASYRRSI